MRRLRLRPEPPTMDAPAADLPRPDSPPAPVGVVEVLVRYCECDPMGVAHHASFVPWLEMGRTELLRASGVSYAQLEAAGVFLVVTKLELRFRRPARYDDVLAVRTRFVGGSRVKLRHEYEVSLVEAGDGEAGRLADAGGVLVVGSSELACVGRDGKVRSLPEWLIEGSADGPATA